MNKCKQCNKETLNPKFCTRSCAATYNNTRIIKRNLTKTCKNCQEKIPNRNTYCNICWQNYKSLNYLKDKTLGQYNKCRNGHSKIRSHAKRVAKPLVNTCKNCGYDLHVDVCHIVDVKNFPDTTPLEIVNHITNLVKLCKNCHWEFDNGYLDLKIDKPIRLV